ncbi:peptide/nickel transport system ATP-binding protein [Tessaracoccus bendigoensis DSM 12906]|uniref:Peptide/nickel transport system ATP-binding protein n=1 Tax=Tessaracoccus bendigoensis DSM 12906 TaxID=1123357 RepID=A0A1M6GDS7_9ACTN|nr:ABC transporter ATP-binding protein [Tessaracoccus bendigoensis]SHJ08039.1 peptide/nickel transport system ATP-binding protein [Tessaracoccus bendigoensis DSM 12906]
MSLVELRSVAATYRRAGRDFVALREVELAIEAGEKVGVVGGSGSGKTTLARLMLGLLKPSAGDVRFQGRSIIGLPERRRGWLRASASMVFQDPNSSLNPRLRLRHIIAEPLLSPAVRNRSDVPEPGQSVLAAAMAGVGLDVDLLDRFPHQLSGGQRQRAAIARSLINDPALLVADEPVSALDVSVRAQVLNLLSDEVSQRGLALVLVSHDLAVVGRLCDRVIVIEHGLIVEQGPVGQVLTNPTHPYTEALVEATLSL